jgi:putative spermidine/putrescine transport system substrate-binding protein
VRSGSKVAACAVTVAVAITVAVAGCGTAAAPASWAGATSAATGGGMSALVAAARAEGHLNVIRLRRDWAGYGAIMRAFTARYGIKITDEEPDATSADELTAVESKRGERAPDVLDLTTAFAAQADARNLLAPYWVQTWPDIPDNLKAADGTWYADYGGYVAIGYDPARVAVPPRSLRGLLSPAYRHQVAITGRPSSPTATGAFDAVWAAALASGGSLNNIQPGLAYFRKLRREGNLVAVTGSPATVRNGTTPILIWWDFLLAGEVRRVVRDLRIVIPRDARFENFYDQAVSATAPHPAAARLWEEFLYSAQGQNLLLRAGARPAELAAMVAAGTADLAALRRLPRVPGGPAVIPSQQQATAAQTLVNWRWRRVLR